MAGMIKFRYALDQDGRLVDVFTLDRSQLDPNFKFYSLDCHQSLIPHLGSTRIKHFKHKAGTKNGSSRETYLHALGKLVFRKIYEACIADKMPFYLDYSILTICDKFKLQFGKECILSQEVHKFDLVNYFDEIVEEKNDGQFRPDLMIVNRKSNQKIYIEIAVTHDSSCAKLESGVRIIEFKIRHEDDIEQIKKSVCGINNTHATLYNFVQKKIRGIQCGDNCTLYQFYYFYVQLDGQCKFWERVCEADLKKLRNANPDVILTQNWRMIPLHNHGALNFSFSNTGMFKYFVAKAIYDGVAAKDCFICSNHATLITPYRDDSFQPKIYCSKLSLTVHCTYAHKCEFFSIDERLVQSYLSLGDLLDSK